MNEEKIKECNFLDTEGVCWCDDSFLKDKALTSETNCSDNPNCYVKQLQTAKEEKLFLEKQIEELANCILAFDKGVPLNAGACLNAVYIMKALTQQNKQMREALENIVNDCTNKAIKCNICSLKKEPCTSYIAQQALKGVE